MKSINSRNMLNELYRPLIQRQQGIIAEITKIHGGFKATSAFYNGHYHKDENGSYVEDSYPIPVISVEGLCDIEIDFDDITVTTKMTKSRLMDLDFVQFGEEKFEVYGLIDYLSDLGTNEDIASLREKTKASDEKEVFISFSMPENVTGEGVLKFLRKLQKFSFYY